MRKRVALVALVTALAVVVGATALFLRPSNAGAQSLVPFHATVSETFTAAPCGTMERCVTAIGHGQAEHLGAITESATVVVNLNPKFAQNGCAPETRTTTLTAANGDVITLYGTGFSCPTSSEAHDNYTITGGTGRFQGVGGSGDESNTHTFTKPGVGVATVNYSGTISSVGSLK